MWYPSTVSVAPTELVTLAQARQQARSEADDMLDSELTLLISVARDHVEKYTGTRLGAQTIVARCDSFDDMARLSEAPVTSVTSIAYVDTDGAAQTLSTDVYEVRTDGLEAAIVLKFNQSWPAIQPGSRITLTAVVGYGTAPPAVQQAQLLLLGFWFANHESVNIGNITTVLPHAVDDLLVNYRRGP